MVCPRCGSDQIRLSDDRVICSNCGELETYRKCRCGRVEKLTRCLEGYDKWIRVPQMPFDAIRQSDVLSTYSHKDRYPVCVCIS